MSFLVKSIQDQSEVTTLASCWQNFGARSQEVFNEYFLGNYSDSNFLKNRKILILNQTNFDLPLAYAILEFSLNFNGENEAKIVDLRLDDENFSKIKNNLDGLKLLIRSCIDLVKKSGAARVSCEILTADSFLQALFAEEKFFLNSFNFLKIL